MKKNSIQNKILLGIGLGALGVISAGSYYLFKKFSN